MVGFFAATQAGLIHLSPSLALVRLEAIEEVRIVNTDRI